MKLILLKTNLKEGLETVSRAIGENTTLPVLKNILIQSFDNQIKISATNLELAINKFISGKIIEEGGLTVPGSTFLSLINNLSDERINLETSNNSLIIKSDNYEAKIQGITQEDFPLIPQIKNKDYFLKINGGILRESLLQVINATQYSDWRQELNGILFDFGSNNLTLVATDSFRLSRKLIPQSQIESNWSEERIIVPLKTIQELTRVMSGDEVISVHFDKSQIVFIGNESEIISRVIDGKFPDYEAIIPQTFDTEVIVERDNLANALKLAGIFSGKANDVRLKIDEGKKSLEIYSSNSQLGENKYLLAVKSTKAMPEMVFNWKYFLDGLKTISAKEIFMGANGDDKPVLIKASHDESLIYLLMPIRQ